MQEFDDINKKLGRLSRWLDRSEKLIDRELSGTESILKQFSSQIDAEKQSLREKLIGQEEELKAAIEEAGKEFSQKKYKLEKESFGTKDEITRLQDEHDKMIERVTHDLTRLSEEKVQGQISYEKQRAALLDVYQQQRNHLLTTREKLLNRWRHVEAELKLCKIRYADEIKQAQEEINEKLNVLRGQLEAKEVGWALSLEAMRRNVDSLIAERAGLEKSLVTIKDEKEKDLQAVKHSLELSKEQLEIDKATIIEKAEEDQRKCEVDVQSLSQKIELAERELQNLVIDQDIMKKNAEEAFEKEETLLKETMRSEADKRDFEQKVFEQEKISREKEIARLKEEFEQKKWHWENQIRTMMMQKSVQEAEFDNERMRTDREARSLFRSLEAKRDELRARLSDLKSKHQAVESNSKKELELIGQRWNWRKNRLWTMWQERLDTLKKERSVLSEQMEALLIVYGTDQRQMVDSEKREQKRMEDLQELVLHGGANDQSKRKQKEIQIELEKTRIIAQIKECETLIADWMDRTKLVQEDVLKQNSRMGDQMNFLEKLLKEEEKEADLFLQIFQKALNSLGVLVKTEQNKREAA